MGYACKLGKGEAGLKGTVSGTLTTGGRWSTGWYNLTQLYDNTVTVGILGFGNSSTKIAYISTCVVWKYQKIAQYQMISGHMNFQVSGTYLQGNFPWTDSTVTYGYMHIS